MNLLPALLFVACVASAAAGDPAPPPTPVRAALSGELKSRFPYAANPDSTPTPAPARETFADAKVVRLAPVIVVGAARSRDLDAALKEQLRAFKVSESWSESPITLLGGKGILPKVELRVAPHVRDNGFDFLRLGFSW